jgi:hypothetical protein
MQSTAAKLIGKHDVSFSAVRCGVVASNPDGTLTVCSGWTRGKSFGFTVQTIPNTVSSARDWLGY